jgi:membrane-bound serine protease (ClpP class)
MDALPLAILLFAAGLVLLLVEFVLPAHGVIGLVGAGAIVAGVGAVSYINQWVGLGLAAALAAGTPFAIALWMKVWPHTPMGRRLILPPPPPSTADARPHVQAVGPVRVGLTGVAVSELRPGGTCEIAGERVGARAELGVIPRGTTVRVIAISDGHPVVRPA